METGIYVALSSQIALERRLTTVADNVANSSTAGFRSTEIKFNKVLEGHAQKQVAFVDQGAEYLSTRNGGMRETGNSLDFAIRGSSWFSIDTPSGQAITRDGRFTITTNGDLVTTEGYPVLDAGGGPIQFAKTQGTLSITSDGVLQMDGENVAALGLFEADLSNGFMRAGGSSIIPMSGIQAMQDRGEAAIVQGYVEESNVVAISEMTQLIQIQRNFDNISALIRDAEGSLESAIKTLGDR